jgi:hypothetical protein
MKAIQAATPTEPPIDYHGFDMFIRNDLNFAVVADNSRRSRRCRYQLITVTAVLQQHSTQRQTAARALLQSLSAGRI